MTEEEARQTICPKYKAAILANPHCGYYPADLNKIDDIKCDASDCMAWRWNDKTVLSDGHLSTYTTKDYESGHCGPGGKP